MEYTIVLNEAEVHLVGDALAALPYGKVVKTLNNIQAQINAQLSPPVAAAAPEEPAKDE